MPVLLDLEPMAAWYDGRFEDGRSVFLVGKHVDGLSRAHRAVGFEQPSAEVLDVLPAIG